MKGEDLPMKNREDLLERAALGTGTWMLMTGVSDSRPRGFPAIIGPVLLNDGSKSCLGRYRRTDSFFPADFSWHLGSFEMDFGVTATFCPEVRVREWCSAVSWVRTGLTLEIL